MLPKKVCYNKILWGDRDESQICKYNEFCNSKFKEINFPSEFGKCSNKICSDSGHKILINNLYNNIVNTLSVAAEGSCKQRTVRKKTVTGWNKYVKAAHGEARLAFQLWNDLGKPISGCSYDRMCETRKKFKNKLKWCQNNRSQIQMDIIAKNHSSKDFKKFWKNTNKMNPRPILPI